MRRRNLQVKEATKLKSIDQSSVHVSTKIKCLMSPQKCPDKGQKATFLDPAPGKPCLVEMEACDEVHALEEEEGKGGERTALTSCCEAEGVKRPALNLLKRHSQLQRRKEIRLATEEAQGRKSG
jgi:hypothetical protein